MHIFKVFAVLFITFVMVGLSEAASGRRRSKPTKKTQKPKIDVETDDNKDTTKSSAVTKYTPIEPTTFSSPVIVNQTILGLRSQTYKKDVESYRVDNHALNSAPVYRQGYAMYRTYVSIPDDRAVRLSKEEERLLDTAGKLCLGLSEGIQTLTEGIDDDLLELATTVKYSNGTTLTKQGIDNTVSVGDINEQDFEVTSVARYNTSIVNGTTCIQVESGIEGTMVTMYETNPDGAGQLQINNKLLPAAIALFAFMNLY